MKTQDVRPTEQFETADFYLSAALLADGIKFLEMSWEGSRAVFTFEPKAAQVALSFFNGTLNVAALKYANAVRNLKGALKQGGLTRF